MAGRKKTVWKGFDYRNCDDFAAYLNHMARQGWHFKEWRAGLVFERGEPENAVYAVEVFTRAEESDTRPLPETREFAEYCEAAGWQFVDAWRKFVVFKRVREDAVPIMTDQERFENIVKAENIWGWHPLIHAVIWCSMQWIELFSMFTYRIFSDYHVIITTVWSVLLLLALLRVFFFLMWKRKCRQRMNRGLSLFFGRDPADQWYAKLNMLVIGVLCVSMFAIGQPIFGWVMLAMYGPILLLGYIVAKLRPDSTTSALIELLGSIAIVLVIFIAALFVETEQKEKNKILLDPPLTYADMSIDLGEPEIRSSREEENIFGSWHYANLDYGVDYLFYDIYYSEYDWVLDKIWKEETDGKANETREDCTEAWGAAEAFRNNAGNYLVRYGDAIWVICPSLDEPLTSEQIELAIAAIRGE